MHRQLFSWALLLCLPALTADTAAQGQSGRRNRGPRPTEEQILEQAKAIHERAFTIDTHVDIAGGRYRSRGDRHRFRRWPQEKTPRLCTS